MILLTLLTSLIALYGAVLSTYMYIRDLKEKKRRITVKISLGYVGKENRNFYMSNEMIILSASNPGVKSVTLDPPTFQLPNGSHLFFPCQEGTTSFPCELTEGKSKMIWIDAESFAAELIKHGFRGKVIIIGVVKDALGVEYKSQPFIFDTDPKAREIFKVKMK